MWKRACPTGPEHLTKIGIRINKISTSVGQVVHDGSRRASAPSEVPLRDPAGPFSGSFREGLWRTRLRKPRQQPCKPPRPACTLWGCRFRRAESRELLRCSSEPRQAPRRETAVGGYCWRTFETPRPLCLCQSLAPPGLRTLTADVVALKVDAGERRVGLQRFANRLVQESNPAPAALTSLKPTAPAHPYRR